jgi:hypothetical protein
MMRNGRLAGEACDEEWYLVVVVVVVVVENRKEKGEMLM